jgi:MFS family permease
VCPWYSYSQIMISEVTPRGKEFLFFALFSIMGKTSAFIGPIVSQAIITADTTQDHPGNNSLPFYFLFGLSVVSMILLYFFVDLKKARIEQDALLAEEAKIRERRASLVSIRQAEQAGDESSQPDSGKDATQKEVMKS